jgi:hypothetical protein
VPNIYQKVAFFRILLEPEYKFSTLPWAPQLNLRYAHFSGDPESDNRVKQTYDPLFTTGATGAWQLGFSVRSLVSTSARTAIST